MKTTVTTPLLAAYWNLKRAIRARNGICTQYAVRRELSAYLTQLSRCTMKPLEVMTPAEYRAMSERRAKRKRKKKGDSDPVIAVYQNIENKTVWARKHNPVLDQEMENMLAYLDEMIADTNGYHGEW